MLPERLIEDDSLTVTTRGVSVSLRLPWYRALPLSCIAGATLAVDGRDVDPVTLRLTVDGTARALGELPPRYDTWWYVLDSAILSAPGARLAVPGPEAGHEVSVSLTLIIPYLPVAGHPLQISERCSKRMRAGTEAA